MNVRTGHICCHLATVTRPGTRAARWKVGRHLGSGTVFGLHFGPVLLVLTPLVVLVGWARWRVGAHAVAQVVVATILAVVITAGTFWVMGVPVAWLCTKIGSASLTIT